MDWHIIDAEDLILGRMCSKIAMLLMGKHKPSYTSHVDGGDFVIVINAHKVKLTGKKFEDKQYVRNTGYPGGKRIATPKILMEKRPTVVVEKAVRGMLPRNKLGNVMYRKLYVYAGTEHPHQAQKPNLIKI